VCTFQINRAQILALSRVCDAGISLLLEFSLSGQGLPFSASSVKRHQTVAHHLFLSRIRPAAASQAERW
jgi:hypothetical protein